MPNNLVPIDILESALYNILHNQIPLPTPTMSDTHDSTQRPPLPSSSRSALITPLGWPGILFTFRTLVLLGELTFHSSNSLWSRASVLSSPMCTYSRTETLLPVLRYLFDATQTRCYSDVTTDAEYPRSKISTGAA